MAIDCLVIRRFFSSGLRFMLYSFMMVSRISLHSVSFGHSGHNFSA